MGTELLKAEWIKLRSVRSTYLSLAAAAALVIIVALSVAGTTADNWPTMSPRDRSSFDPVSAPLFGALFAQLVIGVLAVLVVSSEYSTGLIRTTFAVTPQRRKVLLAKVTVTTALALAAGAVILGAAFLLSQAVMAHGHGGVSLGDPGVLRAVGYAVLYLVAVTVLATSLGAILRSTAGAIAVLFTLVFLVPQVLDHLPQELRHHLMRFGLQRAAAAAVSLHPQADTFSPTVSILLCAGYAAVALALALFLIGRRDA
ncbi:ABC transporter permease [Streptomyces orinoci]|uniref:ABC transporter permease n=1 Tax=Streptomyces orinoci TaxID=67339 RepID=A0ABV3JQ12_STRON|nr:ABC transporter permease [Streptomyces orinoci]